MKNLKKKFVIATAIFLFYIPAANALILLYPLVAATSTTMGQAITVSALAHGAAIAFIQFSKKDENGTPQVAPINIQLKPEQPLVTPEGWTSPTEPPATSSGVTNSPVYNYGQYVSTSVLGVAEQYVADQPAIVNGNPREREITSVTTNPIPSTWQIGQFGGSFTVRTTQNGVFLAESTTQVTYNNNSQSVCPAGYTSSSSTCTLLDPQQVTKPPKGVDEFKREGNNFVRDPQQDPQDNSPAVAQPAPNQIQYTDNETGETVMVSLNSDGTSTVTQSTPNYANGTTTVKTTQVSAPSSGGGLPTVTGQATNTYSGTGTAIGTTPMGGSSSNGTMTCPECATEVTLSNIKDLIEGVINGEESGADEAGEGFAARFNAEQTLTFNGNVGQMNDLVEESGLLQLYQNSILPISPWHMAVNGQSSNCEFGFTLFDETYQISICDAQPFIHSALNFVFFILLVFGVVNLIAERPEGNS
ncbi:hypothetical protein MTYP_01893 [Methylophilaceae bacterium]|nr:hypothetical protein MTYP_01893 [Methylophilaceae bacterium]